MYHLVEYLLHHGLTQLTLAEQRDGIGRGEVFTLLAGEIIRMAHAGVLTRLAVVASARKHRDDTSHEFRRLAGIPLAAEVDVEEAVGHRGVGDAELAGQRLAQLVAVGDGIARMPEHIERLPEIGR